MYRTICVPVDNSAHSDRAADHALRLARAFGARLVGCHVYAARLHELRFKQMEYTLPEEYREEQELERQREVHDSLITLGLRLISDSYLDVLERRCGEAGVTFERKVFEGKHHKVLLKDIRESRYDLVVMGALGMGAGRESQVGGVAERVIRRARADFWLVRGLEGEEDRRPIAVGLDGSPQSFAALRQALALGRAFRRPVEAVAVYDPYLHYAIFTSVVRVLSERAAKAFRFKEQEQLHEELIDAGLAGIYQSHLQVAKRLAEEEGMGLQTTLLDGKAYEKILIHCREVRPWLLCLGRVGVHADDESDLGSNTENLLRLAPCNVLLTGRTFYPPMDVRADEAMAWTEEARRRMDRVPALVRGIARTAILRYAIERGHSVITSRIIDGAMAAFMPAAAHRAMGSLAKEVAAEHVRREPAIRHICSACGYTAEAEDPVRCPVCGAGAEAFQKVDREVVEGVLRAQGGVMEEEAFDGQRLQWTKAARHSLQQVSDAHQRRRAKARIEKAARLKKLSTISLEFARPLIEESVDPAHLPQDARPAAPQAKQASPPPAEAVPREEGSPPFSPPLGGELAGAEEEDLRWTEEAEASLGRVPEGFPRAMTRKRVEAEARAQGRQVITLALAERAIARVREGVRAFIPHGALPSATEPEPAPSKRPPQGEHPASRYPPPAR
ncbi:MAG: universal stress protein [Nitrospinota bacterium]